MPAPSLGPSGGRPSPLSESLPRDVADLLFVLFVCVDAVTINSEGLLLTVAYIEMQLVRGETLSKLLRALRCTYSRDRFESPSCAPYSIALLCSSFMFLPYCRASTTDTDPDSPSVVRPISAGKPDSWTTSLTERRRFVNKVSTAVAALHVEGVVHHDIKPSNIMVVDKSLELVVSDVGLLESPCLIRLPSRLA